MMDNHLRIMDIIRIPRIVSRDTMIFINSNNQIENSNIDVIYKYIKHLNVVQRDNLSDLISNIQKVKINIYITIM
jgi:hypothetical protein